MSHVVHEFDGDPEEYTVDELRLMICETIEDIEDEDVRLMAEIVNKTNIVLAESQTER